MTNIHQEVILHASPARVYQALVDAAELSKITGAPCTGAGEEGAAFSAFGGHITGRHIELLPDRLVVQAWRAKTWPAGKYSIARFELRPQGDDTLLVFDHDGFPDGQSEHLSAGWTANYWEPLRKRFG